MTSSPTTNPSSRLRIAAIVAALAIVVIAAVVFWPRHPYQPPTEKEARIVKLMGGDLIALRTAERFYFLTKHEFTDVLDSTNYLRSVGVEVPIIKLVGDGWYATLTDARLPGVTCAIAVATENPVWKKAEEGLPACR